MKNIMEQIKQTSFNDELQKLAKNQVAVGAGWGGQVGAIVGGAAGNVAAWKLFKILDNKIPKTPASAKMVVAAKAAATIAGAIEGGNVGRHLGAYLGGGVKGTVHME